jgi:hypothetical protein
MSEYVQDHFWFDQLMKTQQLNKFVYRAGCGYGDFLVWSGAPLTPFEDMLYEHNMNFPNNAGYDESPLKNVRKKSIFYMIHNMH